MPDARPPFRVPLERYDNSPDTPLLKRGVTYAANFAGHGRVAVAINTGSWEKLGRPLQIEVSIPNA